jgi:hypothetical protein
MKKVVELPQSWCGQGVIQAIEIRYQVSYVIILTIRQIKGFGLTINQGGLNQRLHYVITAHVRGGT